MINGRRLPKQERLLTFLKVCEVTPADVALWIAALERARASGSAPPAGAVQVANADPRRLGVHASIQVDGATGDVPIYVPRDFDTRLRQALASADGGAFVLLLGPSSAGKTRSLYEGVRAELDSHWLLVPDITGDVVSGLEAAGPGTVVWLDDLQKHFAAGHNVSSTAARRLLDSGVVLAATMWPEDYAARTAPRVPGAADPHADARDLLDMATVIEVSEDLSPAERSRADALTEADPRLRVALAASADGGMIQLLAAGPQLVRWWEQAPTPYAQSVLTAAIDARRLGNDAPLSSGYLHDAAPGYLNASERASAPANWFERAVTYATTVLHGATSALSPVDAGTMGSLAGYTVADYLFQHGRRTRRATCPPDSTWKSLASHTADTQTLRRIGHAAQSRLRLRHAETCFRACLARGGDAAHELIDLLVRQRRLDEATALLRAHSTDARARAMLARLLAEHDDVSALQHDADAGDWLARAWLTEVLARRGDTEALQAHADHGDLLARGRLDDLNLSSQHLDDLRRRAAAGDQFAGGRLAAAEAEYGPARQPPVDETTVVHEEPLTIFTSNELCRFVDILKSGGDASAAADFLDTCSAALIDDADDLRAAYLAETDLDRLRDIADTGEWSANAKLAELAKTSGDLDDLAMAAEDNSFAVVKLADRMVASGNLDDAIRFLTELADEGDDFAEMHLCSLLAAHEREAELADRAANTEYYAGTWIDYLVVHDRSDEALAFLRPRVEHGDTLAASQLGDVLVQLGRVDEAISLLRSFTYANEFLDGDGPAAAGLINVLAQHARIRELREEVDAGTAGAVEAWLAALVTHNRINYEHAQLLHCAGLSGETPTVTGPPNSAG
ncbi:hypothetical protein [Amycolatopsis sp. DG1A-15b]|uniref:hypothetical protein n=1 Tax=Amycolatopsis sp. DG1A-15b TaxID=3052846 RepID=UPI00255B7C8F|nr:hypothetical protein [Amycolatopsis sp. DG1A-15b]WIX85847.1 hypothetical protein QRY02_32175 [Amycolatopsis sp. DG1A-15b]